MSPHGCASRSAGYPEHETGVDVTLLDGLKAGDYLAVLAYLPPTAENDRRLPAVHIEGL